MAKTTTRATAAARPRAAEVRAPPRPEESGRVSVPAFPATRGNSSDTGQPADSTAGEDCSREKVTTGQKYILVAVTKLFHRMYLASERRLYTELFSNCKNINVLT